MNALLTPPRAWNGSKWIRPATRQRIYARDGWRCIWCDRHASQVDGPLSLDHFLSHYAGGSNAPDNLLTSCISCNSRRQHRPALTFALESEGTMFDGAWVVLERVFAALEKPLPVFLP